MLIRDALRVRPGDVITLVGGGGKTAVMFRLAGELTAAGLRVVTTMTTKIFVAQMERAPARLLLDDEDGWFAALPAALAQHRHVLVGGHIGADREKVEGVSPEIVDRIAREGLADVIIVEADGSRRLPFKAPAAHEPVVPGSTTILAPLVGLDVLGQPLDSAHAHRPEIVAALAGAVGRSATRDVDAALARNAGARAAGQETSAAFAGSYVGQPVTPDIVARVLAHAQGGAKGLPQGARLVPLLNKADLADAQEGARELARALLAYPVVDEVILAAAETDRPTRERWGRVAAVVLAAGQGSRFGGLKQVMPWRGRPLVAHVAEQALACDAVTTVVVTAGAGEEQVREAVGAIERQGRLEVVFVPNWAEGQSRSAVQGLSTARATGNGPLSCAIFLLADQPQVTPELLTALVLRHRETGALAVAPRFEGKRGNPVLFDRRAFEEFDKLTGDVGGRTILRGREDEMAFVDWPTDEILRDIDTPEDYAAAQG